MGGVILLLLCSTLPILNRLVPFPFFNVHEVCLYAFWLQMGVVCQQYKTMGFIFIATVACAINTLVVRSSIISLVVVLLFYYLTPSVSSKWIQDIDTKSFGIYLLHSPLIYITYTYIPNVNPAIVIICNFVLFGLISYFITTFIKNHNVAMI